MGKHSIEKGYYTNWVENYTKKQQVKRGLSEQDFNSILDLADKNDSTKNDGYVTKADFLSNLKTYFNFSDEDMKELDLSSYLDEIAKYDENSETLSSGDYSKYLEGQTKSSTSSTTTSSTASTGDESESGSIYGGWADRYATRTEIKKNGLSQTQFDAILEEAQKMEGGATKENMLVASQKVLGLKKADVEDAKLDSFFTSIITRDGDGSSISSEDFEIYQRAKENLAEIEESEDGFSEQQFKDLLAKANELDGDEKDTTTEEYIKQAAKELYGFDENDMKTAGITELIGNIIARDGDKATISLDDYTKYQSALAIMNSVKENKGISEEQFQEILAKADEIDGTEDKTATKKDLIQAAKDLYGLTDSEIKDIKLEEYLDGLADYDGDKNTISEADLKAKAKEEAKKEGKQTLSDEEVEAYAKKVKSAKTDEINSMMYDSNLTDDDWVAIIKKYNEQNGDSFIQRIDGKSDEIQELLAKKLIRSYENNGNADALKLLSDELYNGTKGMYCTADPYVDYIFQNTSDTTFKAIGEQYNRDHNGSFYIDIKDDEKGYFGFGGSKYCEDYLNRIKNLLG